VSYHADAMREVKRFQELDRNIAVDRNDFDYLAEYIINAYCCDCNKEVGNLCHKRELLLKYNVPVFDEYAAEGTCPYYSHIEALEVV
jgi:hypothetical protein